MGCESHDTGYFFEWGTTASKVCDLITGMSKACGGYLGVCPVGYLTQHLTSDVSWLTFSSKALHQRSRACGFTLSNVLFCT
jgi:hypothetical protein